MGSQKITGLANGVAAQDATTVLQVFTSPTFTNPTMTGTVTVPTATPGDSSTAAASTAFVATQAFSTALPSQTGNAGKFVTTNGTTASWVAVVFPAAAYSMNYALYGAL